MQENQDTIKLIGYNLQTKSKFTYPFILPLLPLSNNILVTLTKFLFYLSNTLYVLRWHIIF